MILSADDRRYRLGAAAASDEDGRGVDHGRGYKAAARWRQVTTVIPGWSEGPDLSRHNLWIPGSRFARPGMTGDQIVGFHGAGITR
jgi:hypothetical protein